MVLYYFAHFLFPFHPSTSPSTPSATKQPPTMNFLKKQAASAAGMMKDKAEDVAEAVEDVAEGVGIDLPSLEDIVEAFQDALKEAVAEACNIASAVGGFANNDEIKINLPEKMGPVTSSKLQSKLKMIGKEEWMTNLVDKLNEAAEKAAAEAIEIFVGFVSKLNFDTARQLIKAGGVACMEFMRTEMTESLSESFTPLVDAALASTGANNIYET